jgi:hypothetical protein
MHDDDSGKIAKIHQPGIGPLIRSSLGYVPTGFEANRANSILQVSLGKGIEDYVLLAWNKYVPLLCWD